MKTKCYSCDKIKECTLITNIYSFHKKKHFFCKRCKKEALEDAKDTIGISNKKS